MAGVELVASTASPVAVSVSGTVATSSAAAGTATSAVVAASDTAVTIAATNSGRCGLLVVNAGSSALALLYGAGASPSGPLTVLVSPGVTWSMPDPIYTGMVTGAWAAPVGLVQANGYPSVSGVAYVTEVSTP